MSRPPQRYRVLRALVEQEYLVPVEEDGETTQINGWSLDEVIQSWFVDYQLNTHHATRDAHRVGNGSRVLRVTKGHAVP